MQEQLALYVDAATTGRSRGVKRLSLYLGLAVLLTAASLVAMNSRGGAASKFPRVLVPRSSGTCNGTPGNGFLFTQVVNGAQMNVCISQEGNINQIQYPDISRTQIAWDGYCLQDGIDSSIYQDFSPGAGVTNHGFNAATFTQSASNIFSVTRTTTDGRYQLTEFIKINFQPRSIFVGMTVKNISGGTRSVAGFRFVAPAIDGSAADDEYNEFGGTGNGAGRTGQAFQAFLGPTVGNNSLLFGATDTNALAQTIPVSSFQSVNGCGGAYAPDFHGYVEGGNRLIEASVTGGPQTVNPNTSVNVGKFVYRMV